MEIYDEVGVRGAPPRREWCVVYDPETLQILHIQQIISVDEPRPNARTELESLALENASRYFGDRRLAIMHPDRDDVDPSSIESIDPDSMALRVLSGAILTDLSRTEGQQ